MKNFFVKKQCCPFIELQMRYYFSINVCWWHGNYSRDPDLVTARACCLHSLVKNWIQILINGWTVNSTWKLCTNTLKYIGVLLDVNGIFFPNTKNTSLDKVIIFAISNTLKVHPFNNEIQCSVFDTYVHSVFSYICEIWDFHKVP